MRVRTPPLPVRIRKGDFMKYLEMYKKWYLQYYGEEPDIDALIRGVEGTFFVEDLVTQIDGVVMFLNLLLRRKYTIEAPEGLRSSVYVTVSYDDYMYKHNLLYLIWSISSMDWNLNIILKSWDAKWLSLIDSEEEFEELVEYFTEDVGGAIEDAKRKISSIKITVREHELEGNQPHKAELL